MKSRTEKPSRVERWFEWRMNGFSRGWSPPRRATWLKRAPVIRTIRAFRRMLQVTEHAHRMALAGIGLGHMHPYDEWIIEGIREGWL